jgi:hypothetical protein
MLNLTLSLFWPDSLFLECLIFGSCRASCSYIQRQTLPSLCSQIRVMWLVQIAYSDFFSTRMYSKLTAKQNQKAVLPYIDIYDLACPSHQPRPCALASSHGTRIRPCWSRSAIRRAPSVRGTGLCTFRCPRQPLLCMAVLVGVG